jgi:hypothetical protein
MIAMSVEIGTALTYPYIHVHSLNEIKASLLYWERVRRIVPNSVMEGNHAFGDSREAIDLADRKLLVTTDPTPYEAAASAKFLKHITPHRGRFQINKKTAKKYVKDNDGLHVEKLGGSVLIELEKMGLARKIGDWVGMHQEVGALYMFSLAAEMGQKMKMPLQTSDKQHGQIGQAFLFESSADHIEKTTGQLIELGLDLPSAEDLSDVPLDKVIQFHKNRTPERLAFRTAVNEILETARASDDPNAVSDYIAAKRGEIQATLENYRKTIGELAVGAANSLLKVTVPTSLATAASALAWSPEVSHFVAAAGFSLGIIACVKETGGKLRAARRAAPLHYSQTVREELLGTL